MPAAGAAWATVLCVDDEPNILSALKRVLRANDLCVLTATSGAQALQMLSEMPADLVISDMRMPGMDGAQLLEQVRERWPDAVRLLLTGQSDLETTVAAINRGQIFRYLRKPWDEAELLGAVQQGLHLRSLELDRRRLQTLTRNQNLQLQQLNDDLEKRVTDRTAQLLEANQKIRRGYLKTIKVFSNLLELRGGALAGHGRRVGEAARDIARKMALPEEEVLQVFIAGMLHDIGVIGLPDAMLAKPLARYTEAELALHRQHPARGEQSLLALDDMQGVMPIIRSHHERWDGKGFPDGKAGTDIPLGARIVAIADAFDELQNGAIAGTPVTALEARTLMRVGRGQQFDPEILDVFLHITEPQKPKVEQRLMLGCDALEPDMVLAGDLVSGRGVLMLTAGHRLTPTLIRRIREFEVREGSKLELPIRPRGTP
ncbi:MAG: response regulator [Burkholderiales bacterium]|nr:response regulator [Burkholderiales bacterium]